MAREIIDDKRSAKTKQSAIRRPSGVVSTADKAEIKKRTLRKRNVQGVRLSHGPDRLCQRSEAAASAALLIKTRTLVAYAPRCASTLARNRTVMARLRQLNTCRIARML